MNFPRVILDKSPFIAPETEGRWQFGARGHWPCRWIEPSQPVTSPFLAAYRLKFRVENAAKVRLHVAADERYALWLDGQFVGRGSERGDQNHWFFDSYDFDFTPGEHVLVARVSSLGDLAEVSQISVRSGFLLAPETDVEAEKWLDLLGTGRADWKCQILPGLGFEAPKIPGYYYACGPVADIDGVTFPWDYERGATGNYQAARIGAPAIAAEVATESPLGHALLPSSLPSQKGGAFRPQAVRWIASAKVQNAVDSAAHLADEVAAWQGLLGRDEPLTLEAHSRRRVLLDLENYYCAFTRLEVSGGAGSSVALKWAEALYQDAELTLKGARGEVEGCFFAGAGDVLRPDGGRNRVWEPLEWSAGRYVEVQIEVGDEPLRVESLRFEESRYPLELEGAPQSSDAGLQSVWPILARGVQMCAHETYMDCPFYERLMYAGDTRLQMLTTFVMSGDDALPRRALQTFAWSRAGLPGMEGLTQSRYPSRMRQIIPPFALWWVTMLGDFAMWRGDRAFTLELMPVARGVLDAMSRFCNADGLLEAPNGWNFIDWVPTWNHGIPADGVRGASGPINWTYARALRAMSELETWQGEPELAARWTRQAAQVVAGLEGFWDDGRGLFADDRARRHFSEHSNALALGGDFLAPSRAQQVADALQNAPDVARTTIYFSHYLLEAWQRMRRPDAFWQKLELWRELPRQGFVTPFEESNPRTTRSDCHAWGSHPLFHFYASTLGLRPAEFGFAKVEIAPQLGPLQWARGKLPHPRGWIDADFRREGGEVVGTVSLPPGVEVAAVPPGVRVSRGD